METLPGFLSFKNLDPRLVCEFRALLVRASCSADANSLLVAEALAKLLARSNLLGKCISMEVSQRPQNYDSLVDVLQKLEKLVDLAHSIGGHTDFARSLVNVKGEVVRAFNSPRRTSRGSGAADSGNS